MGDKFLHMERERTDGDTDRSGMDERTDGYKFAVTFLATSGSILYVIYNYFQNMPVNYYWHHTIIFLISGLIFSMLGFLSYVFIKGYLMELKNGFDTKYLHEMGLYLYKYSLLWILILVPSVGVSIIMDAFQISIKYLMIVCVAVLIICLIIVIVIVHHFASRDNEQKKSNCLLDISKLLRKSFKPKDVMISFGGGAALALFLFLYVILAVLVLWYPPFEGHVTVDMESIHYKNDAEIPVSIQVTGPNTKLWVILNKKISGNSSTYVAFIGPIEPIFMLPIRDTEEYKLYSGNGLVGNYMGNGKYYVFINTTNLTTGYYELIGIRESHYKKTCEGKSFYLLNESQ